MFISIVSLILLLVFDVLKSRSSLLEIFEENDKNSVVRELLLNWLDDFYYHLVIVIIPYLEHICLFFIHINFTHQLLEGTSSIVQNISALFNYNRVVSDNDSFFLLDTIIIKNRLVMLYFCCFVYISFVYLSFEVIQYIT